MKIIKQKMGEGGQGVLCGFRMEPKKLMKLTVAHSIFPTNTRWTISESTVRLRTQVSVQYKLTEFDQIIEKKKKWVFQNSISSVYFSSRCFYCTSQKRKNRKTTKALVPNGARQSKNCRYHLATKQANHNEKNGILERLPTEFRKQNSNWKKWVCLEKTLLCKSPIGIDLPQMIVERFFLTDGATRNVEYKIIAIFRRNWSLTVNSPHTW